MRRPSSGPPRPVEEAEATPLGAPAAREEPVGLAASDEAGTVGSEDELGPAGPGSYTHLTPPTIRRLSVLVVPAILYDRNKSTTTTLPHVR